MARADSILQTDPAVFLEARLKRLYDDAKRRAGGVSLSIYAEVSHALDLLDARAPEALVYADAICGRLRLEHGAEA